jgi:hypothetical protein
VRSPSGRTDRKRAMDASTSSTMSLSSLQVVDHDSALVAADQETYIFSLTVDGVHRNAQTYARMRRRSRPRARRIKGGDRQPTLQPWGRAELEERVHLGLCAQVDPFAFEEHESRKGGLGVTLEGGRSPVGERESWFLKPLSTSASIRLMTLWL